MSLPLLHSAKPLLFRRLLLLGFCALAPFVACRTTDPRPGLGGSGGSTSDGSSSGGKGSGSAAGSGGVDFGVAGGGVNGEGGLGGRSGGGTGGTPTAVVGCGDAPASSGDFSKKLLLESAGACSAFHACQLSTVAFELGRQVTLYADDPSEERLDEARAAWIQAVEAWSATAPARFGPIAGVVADKYHGRGIGGFIHVWPALNRCEIEKQVANRAYEAGFDGIRPAARGLPALEYLLFYEGNDTACSAISSAGEVWATLSTDEIAEAKRDYAKSVVQDLYLKTEELVNVWAEDGENFGATLASYEGYGSEQEALNVVAWSLLYPYDTVRDLKVGPLAGIGTAKPNEMTPYAEVDLQTIVANMQAFRALFQGCGEEGAGIGFDDWLVAAGAGDLAADILQALEDIDARASALPPLHEATSEEMVAFYADLKVLSDLLKGQLFGSGSVLNLKLPAGVASDTD
jgi:predicted lipoprotein